MKTALSFVVTMACIAYLLFGLAIVGPIFAPSLLPVLRIAFIATAAGVVVGSLLPQARLPVILESFSVRRALIEVGAVMAVTFAALSVVYVIMPVTFSPNVHTEVNAATPLVFQTGAIFDAFPPLFMGALGLVTAWRGFQFGGFWRQQAIARRQGIE